MITAEQIKAEAEKAGLPVDDGIAQALATMKNLESRITLRLVSGVKDYSESARDLHSLSVLHAALGRGFSKNTAKDPK